MNMEEWKDGSPNCKPGDLGLLEGAVRERGPSAEASIARMGITVSTWFPSRRREPDLETPWTKAEGFGVYY